MPNWSGAASGAATGAAAGSIIPGIGTALGAGVGGLFGLFRGSNKPTATPTASPTTAATPAAGGGVTLPSFEDLIASLQGSSAATRAKGADLAEQGNDALGPVLDYYKRLVGGDQATTLAATQPQRRRVTDQYDTARRAIENFGGRGGGANAAVAQSQFNQATDLSTISAEARTDAASTLAGMGTQLTGLGLSADQIASGDLSAIISAVLSKSGLDLNRDLNQQQLALSRDGQQAALYGSLAEGLGTLLGLFLTRKQG